MNDRKKLIPKKRHEEELRPLDIEDLINQTHNYQVDWLDERTKISASIRKLRVKNR